MRTFSSYSGHEVAVVVDSFFFSSLVVIVTKNMFASVLSSQRSGDVETACARCEEVLKDSPTSAKGWALLAMLELERGREERAVECAERAFDLRRDIPTSRNALVQALTRLDRCTKPRVSTELLERAAAVAEDDALAQFRLGRAARQLGRRDLARKAFRDTLSLDPHHERARFWLATLDHTVSVAEAPRDHVKALYDDYAPRYDQHLTNKLKSRAPMLVAEALKSSFVKEGRGLDFGCGTGLSGAALATKLPRVEWHGVDLSPAMCERARSREIYREVRVGDMLETQWDEPFDCLACCDVLVYLGDLDPFFAAARRAASDSAVLVISLEDASDVEGDGWRLGPSGRFSHRKSYVEVSARGRGWQCQGAQPAILRRQAKEPVQGRIYVFKIMN